MAERSETALSIWRRLIVLPPLKRRKKNGAALVWRLSDICFKFIDINTTHSLSHNKHVYVCYVYADAYLILNRESKRRRAMLSYRGVRVRFHGKITAGKLRELDFTAVCNAIRV